MFIEVKKMITRGATKKAADGSEVRNPKENKTISNDESYEFHMESIRVDEIRSFRPWMKSQMQETIEGDLTVIYMQGSAEKSNKPEILILENYNDFGDRLKTVKYNVKEDVQ